MESVNTQRKDVVFSLFWLGFFLLFALFKLYLIGREEILALYAPHDELWYILAASRWVWFSPAYDLMTLIHLPVYAIYVALVHLTGLPLRIGIELTYILAAFYFVYSLRKIGIHQFVCFLSFALVVFHPVSFDLFNRTLAETFYAPLLLAFLASLILLWISEGRKRFVFSAIAGIFAALLWFTREESILIAGIFFVVAAYSLLLSRAKTKDWKSSFFQLKEMLLAPLVIIAAFSLFIHTANYLKYGVFAASELDAPSYKKAYSALLQIKPDQPVRYVPIATDTREKAYSISPTFKELKPYLENRSNFAFYWTKAEMGIEDEMATGWFYWMLQEAVDSAGYKTAQAESSFYERVADEINRAISEKKVPGRFVPFSFIDPNTFSYLGEFPNSFKRVSGLFFMTQRPPEMQSNLFSGPTKQLIDSMTNRRAYYIETGKITLNGWVFADSGKIEKVNLMDENGNAIASTDVSIPRPDVRSAYRKNVADIPEKNGFSLEINRPEQTLANSVLIFRGEKKQIFKISYSGLKIQSPIEIESEKKDAKAYFAVDEKIVPVTSKSLIIRNKIQGLVWSNYGKIILIFSYLGALALGISVFYGKLSAFKKPINVALLLLFFAIASRVLLLSLLDIDSWNGAQPRYLFPVMPIYSVFLLVLIYQAYGLIKKKTLNKP